MMTVACTVEVCFGFEVFRAKPPEKMSVTGDGYSIKRSKLWIGICNGSGGST